MKTLRPIALFVAAALSASAVFADSSSRATKRNLDIFNSLYKTLITNYVDTINADEAMATAINAMLDKIDPYTEYIREKDVDEFRTLSTGEFGGIGAIIRQLPSRETMIEEPQEGSPAALVGLKAGDVILTIDGDTVTSLGSSKVRERLRGRAGTKLQVTVRRPWVEDSILTFDITRARIEVPTLLYHGVVRDTLGYISLNTYNEKSYPEVRDALSELLADARVQGIVLDLRGNGGGIVNGAIDIVSLFVPKGTEVIRARGRDAMSERTFRTTKKPLAQDVPLVVLIDEGSASASEITAGALQDLDRAVIIGNRSYGKGLVQGTYNLPHNSLLKITTAKYYLPSGRLIQAIDYSRRGDDGSAYHVPDSLTNLFHTAAGREVRDGGGITPDITLKEPEYTRLMYQLYDKNMMADFATRYVAEHTDIAPPGEFVVTDEIFDAFKKFVDPEKFQYDKPWVEYIKNLREVLKLEGYVSDDVNVAIDKLQELLQRDLDADLDYNRSMIEGYIASEILTRTHYARGAQHHTLLSDPAIDEAIKVIADKDLRHKLLSAPKQ